MLAPDHEVSIVQAGTPQTVEGRPGEVVSLLPLAPAASGITLEGFAYPLEDGTLYAARARGVSNELRAPRGHIQLTEGTLLVVHYVTADDDSAAGEEPRT
jgi:thiamine pyrophosphokinase